MKHRGGGTPGVPACPRAARTALALLLTLTTAAGHAETEFGTRRGLAQRVRGYNIRIGKLRLDLVGKALVYGDDNIDRESAGGSTDSLRLEYGADIGIYWPLRPNLRLDLTTFVGRAMSLSGNGPEGMIVRATEGTGIALDWHVGNTGVLSVLETMSIDVESAGRGPTDETSDLRLLHNDLALQYEVEPWRRHHLGLRLGREDERSLTAAFKHRDRRTLYAALTSDWRVNRHNTAGPYLSFRNHRYLSDGHNNADEWEAGLIWEHSVSAATHAKLSVGYQLLDFSFDNVPEAREEDARWTAKFALSSQTSTHTSQGLVAKCYMRPGNAPLINYSRDLNIAYRFDWDLTRHWHLSALSRWIRSNQSGIVGTTDTSWSNEAQLRYLWRRWLLFGGYRHVQRWSQLRVREYTSNQFSVGVEYDF